MKKWRKVLSGFLAIITIVVVTQLSQVTVFAKDNGTMMQYFDWYQSKDVMLWNKMKKESANLSKKGITSLWIPPAYKGAAGTNDVGYGVYDLYDLGEFNQKKDIRTKYGTKDQLEAAIKSAHNAGIQVYADVVLNQKTGADKKENVRAVKVDPNNRNIEDSKVNEISAWTDFEFEKRHNKYSKFKWHWWDFDAVDWDDNTKAKGNIYKICGNGKFWDWEVDTERGNYDYLMGADLDMDHPEVVNELKTWGKWFTDTLNLDGYRLDAVKHIKFDFYKDWLNYERKATGKELFTVGEYLSYDLGRLQNYISKTNREMSLFDFPLRNEFYKASTSKYGKGYDMRDLRNGTLVSADPTKAVTFVDNHDTEPDRDGAEIFLGTYTDEYGNKNYRGWFKPLAYTFILTREQGYPCIFYGDYYGIPQKGIASQKDVLDKLLLARKNFAYGAQHDYFDNKNLVGWTREGDAEHPKSGLAALITSGDGGSKKMYVGKQFSGKVFYDCTGNRNDTVTIDNNGEGIFKVNGGSHSVWIQK